MTSRVFRAVFLATSWIAISAASSPSPDDTFEQASVNFIRRYLQEWSGPAAAALAFMDQVYPSEVNFYGQELDHADLMNVKRRFAARWPERSLTPRPDSMAVTCDTHHLCVVQTIFDWHYQNPQRQANSTGSASLQLQLQDGMVIVGENGSVISYDQTPPAAPAQSSLRSVQQPGSVRSPAAAPDRGEFSTQDLPSLRSAYFAHAADKNWISDWLAQRRVFSGGGTFTGSSEEPANPGTAEVLRRFNFTTVSGTVSCINPDQAPALSVGEKVSIHGVITIFIDDTMYIAQCLVKPA